MRRKWAKTALSCAERNGFVGSDESLSYSIRKVSKEMRSIRYQTGL
jgi:hypothetical protein